MNPNDYEKYLRKAPTSYTSDYSFHDWFNRSKSVEDSTKNGMIDFVHKIFTLDFYKLIGDPTDKTCCDIGFGGGRLMNAAAQFFKFVHGIDIHEDFDRTEKYLCENSLTQNHKLHTMEEALSGSISSESVDFVYSFITFQHFPTWNIASNYLKMTQRILKSKGCGVIYFGFNENPKIEPPVITLPSKIDKNEPFPVVMRASPQFVVDEMKSIGLTSIEVDRGTKKPWSSSLSGQFYVKFVKE